MTKIEGMQGLLRNLANMKQLPEKEIKALTRRGAGMVLTSAKSKCKNIHVKNALGFVTKNDAKFPMVTLIGVLGGNSKGSKTMTAPALAVIEEFGTAERIKSNGASTGVYLARPFMRPAIDENKDKIQDLLTKSLEVIILKQAKKNKLI